VVGKKRNTKILVYLSATNAPEGTHTKVKTLGFNACDPREWVRESNVQAAHA